MIKVATLTFLTLVVCQLNTQSITQNQKDKLIVSFISIGAGIDYKAKDRLFLFVEEFQHQHKVELDVAIKSWGREGEMDCTCDLNKLTKKQCKVFVEKIEEMFSGNNLVKISHSSQD
jgi:hypothetical protein